jgi:hypothetical protein
MTLDDPRQRRLGLARILGVRQAVMTTREPGIFVDDRAQAIAELVIGALPQRAEGAGRGDDRIVIDAVMRADLGDLVGHAGAAGDAMDEAPGAFENAVEDALGGGHLPQDVHVDAALAVRRLVRAARLRDAAADREGDQFLMALAPRAPMIALLRQRAVGLVGIRIDAREGPDAARRGPGPRTLPVGDRDALASLDQGEDLASGNQQGLHCEHAWGFRGSVMRHQDARLRARGCT